MTESTAPALLPGDYFYLAAAIQCLVATQAGDEAAVIRAVNFAHMIESIPLGAERAAALRERIIGKHTKFWTVPSEYEFPDWDDLRGRAPEATGDLSSEAFIRQLRDDWKEL